MVEFHPAAVIHKMYCNLKMHAKHSCYCSEEILDRFIYTQMHQDDIDRYIPLDVMQLFNLLEKVFIDFYFHSFVEFL